MAQNRKEYFQEYNRKNAEKVKERRRLYEIENREHSIERSKNYRKELTDFYIIDLLKQQGFTKEQIELQTGLIELKRITLKTKRLCQ